MHKTLVALAPLRGPGSDELCRSRKIV